MRRVVSSIIIAALKNNPELDLNLNDIRLVSNNHRHITRAAVKKKNGTDELLLVIKYRKKRDPPQTYDFRVLFKREKFIYRKVYEFFQETIATFKFNDSLLLPKCYGFYDTATYHGLTFEDLEARGFRRFNLSTPLDMDHVKLVLEAYAKWHALSFVAKKFHPDQFANLTSNFSHMFLEVLRQGDQIKYTQQEFLRLQNEILNTERKYILRNGTFSDQNIEYALTKMVLEEPDYRVITHADCWVMNYMFRYEVFYSNVRSLKV